MGRTIAKLSCIALPGALLTACSPEAAPAPQQATDPIVRQALFDRLMIDPDLAGQNEGNAALTSGIDHSIPPYSPGRDAIRKARAEAVELAGGEVRMRIDATSVEPLESAGPTTMRGALGRLPEDCAQAGAISAVWAARMPDVFPVFPQAAVMFAQGFDTPACTRRTVRFNSGNAIEDVAGFYVARARSAGHRVVVRQRQDNAAQGAAAAYVIYARRGTSRMAVRLEKDEAGLTVAELGTVRLGEGGDASGAP